MIGVITKDNMTHSFDLQHDRSGVERVELRFKDSSGKSKLAQ